MSFTLPTSDILQAATNVLYSYYPLLALLIGIVIAGFIARTLMEVIRARR